MESLSLKICCVKNDSKIIISFQKSNIEKLNGPFVQYTIAYRESEGAEMLANVTNIDKTFHTIPNLKKWTLYFIKVRVENRDHAGPWSSNKDAKTQQDGLYLELRL